MNHQNGNLEGNNSYSKHYPLWIFVPYYKGDTSGNSA